MISKFFLLSGLFLIHLYCSRSFLIHPKPQEISLIDKETGINVKIIGCMHYNPFSVSSTKDLVQYHGESYYD